MEVVRRGGQPGSPFAAYVRDSLDPGLVMQVDSEADIDRRWAYFMAGKPDFLKLFLLTSEQHAQWRSDPKFEGNRGIDPALVPALVKRAHAAGLQVSAHVYTAADFRVAVEGGVDHIAHIPGGPTAAAPRFLLTDRDAQRAAQRQVTVATTVSQHGDSALTDRLMREQYVHNITVLRKNGAKLVLGSDAIDESGTAEVAALRRSKLFTNLELLRLWSVITPQSIFPHRKIGLLQDGYEASFLVLRNDPLADFTATRGITIRVKQGTRMLAVAP